MNRTVLALSVLGGLMVSTAGAQAHVITGSGDVDWTTSYQGASAADLQGLGYSVGTGATDLKVHTEVWTDPSGFGLGTMLAGSENLAGSGRTTGLLTYAYDGGCSGAVCGNSRDYNWVQNAGTNGPGNPSLDTPWLGSIWDLGGPANQAVVFPIVDHGPLPQEVLEYTVYLTNDPTSTNLADWNLAILDSIFMQGWQDDSTAIADGYTTVWKLPGGATFRYVSVEGVGSQSLAPNFGNEDEIDAVAGLTAEGTGVNDVPEPVTLSLFGAGLAGAVAMRRRKKAA